MAWAPLPSAVSGGQQPGRMTRQVPTALFIVWSLARLELDTVVLVRVHWALACGTACLPRPPGAPLPGLNPASRSRGLRMVTWWLSFRRHLTSSLTPRALPACCPGLFPGPGRTGRRVAVRGPGQAPLGQGPASALLLRPTSALCVPSADLALPRHRHQGARAAGGWPGAVLGPGRPFPMPPSAGWRWGGAERPCPWQLELLAPRGSPRAACDAELWPGLETSTLPRTRTRPLRGGGKGPGAGGPCCPPSVKRGH